MAKKKVWAVIKEMEKPNHMPIHFGQSKGFSLMIVKRHLNHCMMPLVSENVMAKQAMSRGVSSGLSS